jgi:uncharacterized membrane protein
MDTEPKNFKPFSCADIRLEAWKALSGNWTFACLLAVLYAVLELSQQFLPGLFPEGALKNTAEFFICILLFPIDVGLFACFYDVACKKAPSYGRLFVGYTSAGYFFKVLVTQILAGIYVLLWSLLLIVPGILKLFSYSLTYLILVDYPECSPNEAITRSKKMMYGHRLELFRLFLSFIGWWLLCFVTFGIATIWVVPYWMTAIGKFYENLKGNA